MFIYQQFIFCIDLRIFRNLRSFFSEAATFFASDDHYNKNPILLVNSFTEMASRMMPKNLRNI